MKGPEQISPVLKAWFDNVIVPVLVKEYISERQIRNEFASQSDVGLESPRRVNPTSEEGS